MEYLDTVSTFSYNFRLCARVILFNFVDNLKVRLSLHSTVDSKNIRRKGEPLSNVVAYKSGSRSVRRLEN